MEFSGGFVGVDEGEKLHVGVSHATVGIVVTEVVHRVDRPKDAVANQPVTADARPSVRMLQTQVGFLLTTLRHRLKQLEE